MYKFIRQNLFESKMARERKIQFFFRRLISRPWKLLCFRCNEILVWWNVNILIMCCQSFAFVFVDDTVFPLLDVGRISLLSPESNLYLRCVIFFQIYYTFIQFFIIRKFSKITNYLLFLKGNHVSYCLGKRSKLLQLQAWILHLNNHFSSLFFQIFVFQVPLKFSISRVEQFFSGTQKRRFWNKKFILSKL